MIDRWWAAMRTRRLRFSVASLVCLSIISAFVADAHMHALHAAHPAGGHHHALHHPGAHDHNGHDHAAHDHSGNLSIEQGLGIAEPAGHGANAACDEGAACGLSLDVDEDGPVSSGGDHSHFCMAFVMPSFLPSMALRMSDCHPRPLNEYPSAPRSVSLYRPPISIL